jgi:prevent-host-death family protein
MVSDYGNEPSMQTIAIGKFKATCLAVLERVRRTREPVLVTRRGVPVAEIKPPPLPASRLLGSMQGTVEIIGDIVGEPAEPEDAWEALRE